MTKKSAVLDSALEVLREGKSLTIDAVASAANLTKPGVVHHFATKETLTLAVVDHVLDAWEEELRSLAGEGATATQRLQAYVRHTLLGDMDPADLALLSDPKLRGKLSARWAERMDDWCGRSDDPHHIAARLVADGAWIDRCLDLLPLSVEQRSAVVAVAIQLIETGEAA